MTSEGRFILINGILCRTADDTGLFCPSDIFSGYNPHCFLQEPQNQNLAATLAANLTEDEIRAEAMPTISSKCPVYRHFSVLSGGVLIDPRRNTFVDFTDPCTYDIISETTMSKKQRKKAKEASKCDSSRSPTDPPVRPKRVKKRIEKNMALYKQGCLEGIKAEAVVSLVSSIEPIGTKGTADTPLAAPNTYPRLLRLATAVKKWKHNMRYIKKCSVLSLRPRSPKYRKLLMRNLKFTELFRLCNKERDAAFGGISTSTPFHLQAHGTRFLPYSESALLNDQDATEDGYLRTHLSNGDEGGNDSSSLLFTSSFAALAGNRHLRHLATFDRRMLNCLSAKVHSFRVIKQNDLHTFYEPLHAWAVMHEAKTQLLPPLHFLLTPIRQLEWVFNHYFEVLGVKESAAQGTEQFTLSGDADFSISDAVSVAIGSGQHEQISAQSLKALRTTASRDQICTAWLSLFAHSRQRILRRLREMLRYLVELSK